MNEETVDKNEAQEETGKTMAERAQEIGRDGAYLEVDAKDLISLLKSGDLQKARIVVIKSARIELSEPEDIQNLILGLEHTKLDPSLTDEQFSVGILNYALSEGLYNLKPKFGGN
jgi:hypothetical protein